MSVITTNAELESLLFNGLELFTSALDRLEALFDVTVYQMSALAQPTQTPFSVNEWAYRRVLRAPQFSARVVSKATILS